MILTAGKAVHRFAAVTRCRLIAAGLLVLFGTAGIAPSTCAFENSEPAPLAARSALLDIAQAGDRLVAVGDHGNVVVSSDDGQTWTQRSVPTRALLTAVSFPDPQHGWAVGHEGVILSTNDGGLTWQRQDDGKDTSTVFLDVRFLDDSNGFAVGAYGKFLVTADGGKTWTAAKPMEEEVHYNRMSRGEDDALYLAGESGTLLVSQDRGKKWRKTEVPYDGSLFGALPLGKSDLLVYGLRGHIFRSDDQGAHWEPENSDTKVLILCGLRLKGGAVVLGGQAGNFFVSRDDARTFETWKPAGFGTGIAALIEGMDGSLITVGEAGVIRLKAP